MTVKFIIALVIVCFLTMIASQKYVTRLSNRLIRVLTELIKMNEISGFDPVWLIKNMEPFLCKMMVKEYSYYLFYLNTEYSRQKELSKGAFHKFIFTSEYTLLIGFDPVAYNLNSKRLVRAVTEIIFLMLKSDINISVKSAENAFKRSAEIQTFINHDAKNLIQFINMLEFNLKSVETDDEKKRLIKYLRMSLPSIKNRADKILAALNSANPGVNLSYEEVDPYAMAAAAASVLSIDIKKASEEPVVIMANKKVLSILFENIIKNFYDKSLTEKGIELRISVDVADGTVRIIIGDNGSPIADCEKIFEPFFSDKTGGLGIGLFHCRSLATSVGGRMWARNTPDGPEFIIDMKKQHGARQ